MSTALVDTGSAVTLARKSLIEELRIQTTQSKNLPQLVGITHDALPVLGTAYLDISIGNTLVKHMVAVVPDNFLEKDVLFGADILQRAPFTWDGVQNKIVWNSFTYPVYYLKARPSRRRIRQVKVKEVPSTPTSYIRLRNKLVLPRYTAGVYPVDIVEEPDTLVEFVATLDKCQAQLPVCLKVTADKQVFLPFVNSHKAATVLKPGTMLGSYRCINSAEEETSVQTCNRTKILNDLVPTHPISQDTNGEDKEGKFKTLLQKQDWSHLTHIQRLQLRRILLNNQSTFIVDQNELGTFKNVKAHINVKDTTPIRAPMYRYPEKAKPIIAKMLEEMEQKGVIEPSTAAWLSPIVLVKKPDGSQRMCLDYRQLNTRLEVDIHPLPRLEELVEAAAGNKYYTTLDLKDAYYQVLLDEESRDITTFTDGVSLYRFRRLPFGLSCSPAIFSRIMKNTLAPLSKLGWVKNYLDDVVIWAPSFSAMLKRLDRVFQHFSDQGIKLNVNKCNFCQNEVKFLGHIISEDGCKPCPDNVAAVTEMKAPKSVRDVRRFLGMCGFYRKHIKNFAKIALPLTELLSKDKPFLWDPKCQESFETLKTALTTAPVLVRAHINQPFELHTDASSDHVGAVLMQKQKDNALKPIGYFSKKLKRAEQGYSATDREALAIILSCRKFHHHLWGVPFTIHTDHQPLVSVFKKKTKSPRMNRWAVEMQDYRFRIEYKAGKKNVVADQLSRPVRTIFRQNHDNYLGLTKAEMIEKQKAEPRWRELASYLEGGALPRNKYPRTLLNQFLMYEGLLYLSCDKHDNSIQLKLIIPQDLRKTALEFGHALQSGHLGRRKTIDKLETFFYWPSLRSDVAKYVKECTTCQQHKGQSGLQQPWQELPPVKRPLDRISIDLTDMQQGNNGYRYVLTVIDHYSRYVKFYPLRSKTTEEVGKNFQKYLVDFGTPLVLISDRGGEFTSVQFQQLCQRYNISVGFTTPYHPRGNSITERVHGTMKTVLGLMCKGSPYQWPKYLGETQKVLNTAVHTTLGEQPHFVFFSRRAPRQVNTMLPNFEDGVEDSDVEKAHKIVQETHQLMARQFRFLKNQHRKSQSVEEGSLVWIKKEHVIPGTARKLNAKWVGPYRVLEKIRNGAKYKLVNPLDQTVVERAAEKIKPYYGDESWLLELEECSADEPDIPINVDEPTDDDSELHELVGNEPYLPEDLPKRVRKPPRRLIEEV